MRFTRVSSSSSSKENNLNPESGKYVKGKYRLQNFLLLSKKIKLYGKKTFHTIVIHFTLIDFNYIAN